MGNKEGALVNISMAMDLIEQALPSLGSESEEGQKALAAIRSLTGLIGPRKGKTNELQQSEIMQMLQNLRGSLTDGSYDLFYPFSCTWLSPIKVIPCPYNDQYSEESCP